MSVVARRVLSNTKRSVNHMVMIAWVLIGTAPRGAEMTHDVIDEVAAITGDLESVRNF